MLIYFVEPEPDPVHEPHPFTDVPEGIWFAEAVQYVWEKGLMNGVGETEFAPYLDTTRATIVTVLYRLAGEPEVTAESFPDVPADAWYAKAVAWAKANGIIKGYDDGLFHGSVKITREQIAAILYRMAGSPAVETVETGASGWAVDAMSWAAKVGLLQGNGTNFNAKGTATRAEVALILMRYDKL